MVFSIQHRPQNFKALHIYNFNGHWSVIVTIFCFCYSGTFKYMILCQYLMNAKPFPQEYLVCHGKTGILLKVQLVMSYSRALVNWINSSNCMLYHLPLMSSERDYMKYYSTCTIMNHWLRSQSSIQMTRKFTLWVC